jgi:hypothetical protein
MLVTLLFFYAVHFSAQLLFKLENGYRYAMVIKLVGPVASYCLNCWRDGSNQETMYGLYAMINYDLLFMS